MKRYIIILTILIVYFPYFVPPMDAQESVIVDGIAYRLHEFEATVINDNISDSLSDCGCTYMGNFTIPETISYNDNIYTVTAIGSVAFAWAGITSVTLPTTLTKIEDRAFSGCRSLTSIYLHENLNEIGFNIFDGCDELARIDVDDRNKCFTSIDGVLYTKDLCKLICWPCKNESEIQLLPPTTHISPCALMNCTIPSNIISEGICDITEKSFYCCIMDSIIIPSGIQSIEANAFYGCWHLKEVICLCNVPPHINSDSFWMPSQITLHVPAGCAESYRRAEYWKDFGQIVEDVYTAIAEICDSPLSPPLYDLQGRQLKQKPSKGMYIQGGHIYKQQ